MNKILLNLILVFTTISSFSQTTQRFTKQFETSSGIYGYVNLSTRPTTVGAAYIWIQQDAVVVEGIRTNGQNFNGSSLGNYGVSFPYNCSNCYLYADGQVSMLLNGTRYYGRFNKGGSINSGGMGKTNQSVNFSQSTKDLHNQKQRELGYSLWERTGQVESLNIYNVRGADFGNITRAVDKYNKDKQKTDKFNNLISQASNSSLSDNQRLSYLNQAKQYAQTNGEQNKINSAINKLNQQIQRKKQQNQNTTISTTTQTIGAISSVSSISKSRSITSQKQVMYDANGLPTTPEIEAIKARSQAEYNRKAAQIQAIGNVVTGIVNYFEQRRQQQLAYEERQRELKAQEERKKDLFRSQANQYRSEYKKIINARKTFVNQSKLKSTLDEDGTSFKPLYIYFAYVPKNYDYYYENVSYPHTLDFRIEKDVDVQFSPVFGFFPYSNGQYPFIKDIKKKILKDYFGRKAKDYYAIFFQWEDTVENIVTSLKTNMNNAVSNSYFTNALPSNENQILFLNNKVTQSTSKDYWTGKKVSTKKTKEVNYFDDNKKKKQSKKDYWSTNTKKKKDSTKNKTKNYWNN